MAPDDPARRKPDITLAQPLWASAGMGGLNEYYYAQDFLYNNRVAWPEILFLGRLPTIALTAVFGLTLALWTCRRAGLWASVIALTLFVFDPTILAHGRYATNDLWVSFFIFAACTLWDAALSREHSIPYFVAAGVALGCALGTKASAICLPFIFVGLAVARRTKWKPGLTGAAIAGLVAVAVATALSRGSLVSYYAGFLIQFNHFKDGHRAYLFGARSATGWWYYYPCAFLIKTPLAELFLTALLPGAMIRSRRIPNRLDSRAPDRRSSCCNRAIERWRLSLGHGRRATITGPRSPRRARRSAANRVQRIGMAGRS